VLPANESRPGGGFSIIHRRVFTTSPGASRRKCALPHNKGRSPDEDPDPIGSPYQYLGEGSTGLGGMGLAESEKPPSRKTAWNRSGEGQEFDRGDGASEKYYSDVVYAYTVETTELPHEPVAPGEGRRYDASTAVWGRT